MAIGAGDGAAAAAAAGAAAGNGAFAAGETAGRAVTAARGEARAAGVPMAPATGDWTLPRGGALDAGTRTGCSRAAAGAGRAASASLAGDLVGSGARAGGGAADVGDGDFGGGALGCALGGDSAALPSSPRLRSREKMLMLPPTQTLHRPLARQTLGKWRPNLSHVWPLGCYSSHGDRRGGRPDRSRAISRRA